MQADGSVLCLYGEVCEGDVRETWEVPHEAGDVTSWAVVNLEAVQD